MADLYERLRDKLDQMATGYPATPNGVELKVLRHLFSEQDAEMFLAMDATLETPVEVAARLGTDTHSMAARLEDMAKRGLLFRLRQDDAVRYCAIPFIVGIYEFQVNNLSPELLKDFSEYYISALGKTFHGARTPHQRTIPIETGIPVDRPIAIYDDAAALIKVKTRIAIAECLCRRAVRIYGKHCKHPMDTCMQFDSFAEYYVDNGMARYISTDEALSLLKRNEQEGLVLQTLNSQNPEALCACCSCCCGMLISLKLFPSPARAAKSNYVCWYDETLCTSCGMCGKRCPVGAFKLIDGKASFRPERCIGCGLCVPTCPGKAHKLISKPSDMITTPPDSFFNAFNRMQDEMKKP